MDIWVVSSIFSGFSTMNLSFQVDLQIFPGAQRGHVRLKQKIGGWRLHYLEEPQADLDVPLKIRIE